jgi:hypothetical protein
MSTSFWLTLVIFAFLVPVDDYIFFTSLFSVFSFSEAIINIYLSWPNWNDEDKNSVYFFMTELSM